MKPYQHIYHYLHSFLTSLLLSTAIRMIIDLEPDFNKNKKIPGTDIRDADQKEITTLVITLLLVPLSLLKTPNLN